MKFTSTFKTLFILALVYPTSAIFAEEPLDYQLLNHEIRLESLRGGNHSPSGTTRYDIRVDFYMIHNSEEERKKPFPEQKKIKYPGGFLGEITLPNLSYWKPEKTQKENIKFTIQGDDLRSLYSKAMQAMQLKEHELRVAIEVTMVEKQKKYWVLNDDRDLVATRYFPIPPTPYVGSLRVNHNLILKDDNALVATLKVVYEHPLETDDSKSEREPL